MKYIITEPQFQRLIDKRLLPTPEKVYKVLNSLEEWIYYSSGLGMEKTIDDILDSKKSKLSESEIENNIKGAKILLDNRKISQSSYDYFVKHISDRKLVYDENGNWIQVNKLNTNYSDLSQLLTDFLFESASQGGLSSKQILELINDTSNPEKIKDILIYHKNRLLSKLKEKYSESPEELFDYVGNSTKNSEDGERLENEVRDRFLSKPYFDQLLYQGGNGNFVDMIFSVDLIVRVKNGSVYTIQVKSNEGQVKKFISNTKKNKAVDLVVWPGNGKTFNVKKVRGLEKIITI
jgi:hypothetical protein